MFGILLCFGIFNFSDYGISWDEEAQREIGTVSYNYLVHDDPQLLKYRDRDYGVAFELPLIGLEKLFGLEDSRDVYLMRHLVTHLFFLFCLWCGYWLIFGLFKNHWLAAIGVLMVVLHPHIYAHSFFNTKDIPFMSMFFVCFLFIFKSFQHHRYVHFIIAGSAIALLVNLRIMGIMLLGLVVFFLIADLVLNRHDNDARIKTWRSLLLFLLSFWVALYFSWPYLYDNPLDKIGTVFSNMSSFRWTNKVLYFGKLIKANELPWHYPIVWFGISTPLVYLLIGLISTGFAAFHVLRHPLQWLKTNLDRQLVIYLVCFLFPFAAVIVLDSVLYDGWRHLYFIYPAFVMLVLFGIHSIKKKEVRFGVYALLLISFALTIQHMLTNHPFQHVYFNALINRNETNHERRLFELDYWGVSYREGLQEILRHNNSREIRVHTWNKPGHYNLKLIPRADRKRIHMTDDEPNYFITAYRWHPDDFEFGESAEIYSIQVQNNTILSVFKLEGADSEPKKH